MNLFYIEINIHHFRYRDLNIYTCSKLFYHHEDRNVDITLMFLFYFFCIGTQFEGLDAPPLNKFISVSFRRTFLKLDDISSRMNLVDAYKMRIFHPKSGFNLISYKNESAKLLQPRTQQYITRYHLIDKYKTYIDPNLNLDLNKMNFNDRNDILKNIIKVGIEEDVDKGKSNSINENLYIDRNPMQLLYLIDRNTPSPIRESLVSKKKR